MYIKFLSHRQRDRAIAFLGRRRSYCSFRRSTGYGVFYLSDEEIFLLRKRGVKFTKLRGPFDDIFPCIG